MSNWSISNASTVSNRVNKSNLDSVIKILAIGNVFSQDAIETYLFELADAASKKVIIGNLYIGGASFDLHWNNAKDDKAAYRKN